MSGRKYISAEFAEAVGQGISEFLSAKRDWGFSVPVQEESP